jgi:hypothetical protein
MDPDMFAVIAPGQTVLSSDGEKIGTVAVVHDAVFRVEKGFIFVKDYNVPHTAVASVDLEGETVHLNVTKDEALASGWELTEDDHEVEDAYDTPLDGDGNTVLTGAAAMPSPLIVEEISDDETR